MKRLIITIMAGLLLLACPALHAQRVLYIGDSVTDGGWGRSGGSMAPSDQRNQKDLNHIYGHGYMFICAAHYESTQPYAGLQFFNRGISGNTLDDLKSRWQQDVLDLKPDMFHELQQSHPNERYWIWDAVHPTPAGHQRMADLWISKATDAGWLLDSNP